MKLLRNVIVILVMLTSFDCMAIGADKVTHFSLAFVGQTVCAELADEISGRKALSELGCFVAVNTAGVIKEVIDPHTGGKRELGDIGANLIGSGLSIGVRINW